MQSVVYIRGTTMYKIIWYLLKLKSNYYQMIPQLKYLIKLNGDC